jgi:aspartate aminotransferase/aromatic-amino-acid transaminase
MFDAVALAPPDPILGLSEAFSKDPRSNKINLTIGVYQDDRGQTPVLECVKRAEQKLWECEPSKSYLAIDGLPAFRQQAFELALGGLASFDCTSIVQTPGGTGALKVAADLLRKNFGPLRVWVSTPTWPNHNSLFESAGLEVKNYPYLSSDKRSLDFAALLACFEKEARQGDVVCLHGCCHNPSGIDPTSDQWRTLFELTKRKGLLPLIDFAYQGFGRGLEEDRECLRAIQPFHDEYIVCSSFSKNFGLYSERVGALMVVCGSDSQAKNVSSSARQVVRTNYSNPPRHGGALIATILSDPELKNLWLSELTGMCRRIQKMRELFVKGMRETGCSQDFSFLLHQLGMFSFSGLTPMQVDWLRTEKGIYMIGNGRINVAGMTPDNLPQLTSAVAECLRI